MKNEKMVLFDWNGTLIDDALIWHRSVSRIFELYDMAPPSMIEYFKRLDELKSYLEVYHSLGIPLSQPQLDEIYQAEYEKHLDEIELFPEAESALKSLKDKGVILGIISSQLRPLFYGLFERLGLEQYFDEVVTDAQKKNAIIVRLCLSRKIPLGNCYYIGDIPSDVRSAKNAGVKSIAYFTGHIPTRMLLANKPDFLISSLRELPALIGGKK